MDLDLHCFSKAGQGSGSETNDDPKHCISCINSMYSVCYGTFKLAFLYFGFPSLLLYITVRVYVQSYILYNVQCILQLFLVLNTLYCTVGCVEKIFCVPAVPDTDSANNFFTRQSWSQGIVGSGQ